MVNDTVNTFMQDHKTMEKPEIMPYCRSSVEKFIFSKLYDRLFGMYILKSEDEDIKLIAKRPLLRVKKGSKLMRILEVTFKFKHGIVQGTIYRSYRRRGKKGENRL